MKKTCTRPTATWTFDMNLCLNHATYASAITPLVCLYKVKKVFCGYACTVDHVVDFFYLQTIFRSFNFVVIYHYK